MINKVKFSTQSCVYTVAGIGQRNTRNPKFRAYAAQEILGCHEVHGTKQILLTEEASRETQPVSSHSHSRLGAKSYA